MEDYWWLKLNHDFEGYILSLKAEIMFKLEIGDNILTLKLEKS